MRNYLVTVFSIFIIEFRIFITEMRNYFVTIFTICITKFYNI